MPPGSPGAQTVTSIDGVFGANTDRAVRAFQAASNIGADGVVGEKTWERLVGERIGFL